MSDYINTTFMDKSSWDRIYSTSLEIYDFDKSKIVSESQKFILNAQTTFISMAKDILVGINMYMPQLSNFAQYSNAFSDQILNNESITSSSFNPKILDPALPLITPNFLNDGLSHDGTKNAYLPQVINAHATPHWSSWAFCFL